MRPLFFSTWMAICMGWKGKAKMPHHTLTRNPYALRRVLEELKAQNYIIGIISWSSKTGSPKFAKRNWSGSKNIICWMFALKVWNVKICYRTTLSPAAILIDDIAWNDGTAIDPTETNLIEELAQAR